MNLVDIQAEIAGSIFGRRDYRGLDIVGGEVGFGIYRHTVFVSLVRVLEGLFPLVSRCVGVDFRDLARGYIEMYPPHEPHLLHYGSGFADFLSDDFLSQLCRVEWFRNQVYASPFEESLQVSDLAELSDEQRLSLRLRLHSACCVVGGLSANVVRVLTEEMSDEQLRVIMVESVGQSCDSFILLTRPDFNVETRILSVGGDVFLRAIGSGSDLGGAIMEFMDNESDESIEELLSVLLMSGCFVLR